MSRVRVGMALSVLLAMASFGAGCGENGESPASPSPVPATSTRLFAGTLPVQGSGFYSFEMSRAGIVDVTLVSLTAGTRGTTLNTVVALGTGTPNGTRCDLTTSVDTAPGLTSQLTSARGSGVHCVALVDVGHLTTAVNFTVRIVHP